MHPRFTVRRFLVFVGVGAIAVAAPFAVLAATGTFNGAAERQSARWTTTAVSTSSKTWKNVPGLVITRCTLNQVTLMLSVNVEGGPVRFRAIIDDVPAGTSSMIARKRTGPPSTLTLSISVTWLRVHRVITSPGTFFHVLLEVETAVVVHLALCRSAAPLNVPVAARTANGAATAIAPTPTKTRNLRTVNL